MELVEEYKKTEIGLLPNDWNVKTLGDVGEVQMCKRIFSSQTSKRGDVPFFKIGTFGKEPNAYISKELYKEFRRKYSFPKIGSILISASGTIGRTVEYLGKDAYYQDSNIIWLDNDEKLITNKYLYYTLKVIEYNTEGSTIKRLYNKIIKSSKFAIPSTIEEQQAITKVLSDTDKLINSLERKIEKKKLLKQGVMHKLLTPQDSWKTMKLGDSAILKARIGWQGLTTAEYLDSGEYHLVTGTDFKSGYIDWENCVYVEKNRFVQDKNIQVHANDILVTKDGTIGKVAFISKVKKPATLNSGVFVIRPKNGAFIPKFFYFILMSDHFATFLKKLTAGSTISHLYQKDFVHYEFQCPTHEKQIKIANTLEQMDMEINHLIINLRKYSELKEGLMQQLLTGKIRLV